MTIKIQPSADYVKFIRGTTAVWESLDDSMKNDDTLYFITDSNSTTGKLYLGAKLISNGAFDASFGINQLEDVILSADIEDDSLLVYDDASDTWINKSLIDVLSEVIFTLKGATSEKDGIEGLVPVPKAGQQGLFLRGDATWADPTAELSQTVSILIGDDSNTSVRKIVQQEIAKLTPGGDTSGLSGRIVLLEEAVNDSDTGLQAISTKVLNLTEQFENLDERLKWSEIV